ncbi:MAG TPA: RraA family protein [Terriglobia bacterium]|jgi:regulator of RNase E activity RraA|nr:RraA family protein [Terriglobia bacterium]
MDDIISFLKTIDTPTVCNAIELLDVRPGTENFTSNKIKCLYPELGSMAGYAVTVQIETVTRMVPRDPAVTMKLYEAVEASPKPVVVVIQEIGGYREFAAHTGDVMTTLLQNFGAIGLVTDCNVRDFNEVRQLGFHTFAAGTSPSHVHCRIADVGMAVQVHGMTVRQGDIIHGDINGLVQVPFEKLDELPEKIAKVRQDEKELMDRVKAGGFTLDDLRERLFGK